jgi:hypothetical protein
MPFINEVIGTIKCEDCGFEYETIRKNTKRCSVCQLIRSLLNVRTRGDHSSECICGTMFLPVGGEDTACAECALPSKRPGAGICAYCEQDKPYVRVDVHVCVACSQDPTKRKMFYRGLKRKQQQRREECHA